MTYKVNETDWHSGWKEYYQLHHGAQLEVRIGSHICDVLLPDGRIIEIQRKPLSVNQIWDREMEYQDRLTWLYCSKFFLNRVTGVERDGDWNLAVNSRFRFRGKIPTIVYHNAPVWVEHLFTFYRLYVWHYNGKYYGKFKEAVRAYT